MIGERLGEWVIEAELGHGPLGRVFRARSAEEPGRFMALKWLTHPRAREPGFQQRFQAEMALLRRLDHPNIVRCFDHGIHDGAPFYVSDLVEGPDCESLVREGKRPGWKATLALAMPIVSALLYAHRRGVLHRGLKPANVLLASGPGGVPEPRLTDFGVAKLFADAPHPTDPAASGSYLVPELAAGKPVSKRSDFYALGVTLYTLITGRAPFTGSTVVELIHKHCFVLPERPQHYAPDMPDDLDRLILKLMAKEPSLRPGSGTLLLGELERIWGELERRGEVGKRPTLPPTPSDLPEPAALADEDDEAWDRLDRTRGNWGRGLALAVLFALVAGVLVWTFAFRGPEPEELFTKGEALLQSADPADWERAWRDYFEPLARRYPDRHEKEVREARRRAEDLAELRRSFVSGRLARPATEAERFYQEGLRLCQAGEFHAAGEVWENLIRAFGGVEKEQRWVRLARLGLERLRDAKDAPSARLADPGSARAAVAAGLAEADRLRKDGKTAEADALLRSLARLYRDDPDPGVRELLRKDPSR